MGQSPRQDQNRRGRPTNQGAVQMMRKSTVVTSILLASTALTAAQAQTLEPQQDTGPGEIIVTGTRAIGQLAADSPAPIQLLSEDPTSTRR